MKEIHISLSSDNNYVPQMAALIASIGFYNSKDFDLITIHVLSSSISSENKIKLEQLSITYPNLKILYYDVYDLIVSELYYKPVNKATYASYARLFLPSILDSSIKKVLYLDVDGIILGSLVDLWNIELEDKYVAGVLDLNSLTSKQMIGLSEDDYYINAGVVLFSLDLWRKNNIQNLCVKVYRDNKGNIYHEDQGLINLICRNKIYVLPPKYNLMTNYLEYPFRIQKKYTSHFYDQQIFKDSISNPIFLHFTASYSGRPWVSGSKHPYKAEFIRFLKMTPWKDFVLLEDSRPISQKLLSFLFFLLPFELFYALTNIYLRIKK